MSSTSSTRYDGVTNRVIGRTGEIHQVGDVPGGVRFAGNQVTLGGPPTGDSCEHPPTAPGRRAGDGRRTR